MERGKQIILGLVLGLLMPAAAWLTDGVLELLLVGVLYFAEAELLTTILRERLDGPQPSKATKEERIRAEDQWYLRRQDPAVMDRMRPLGIALDVVAVAVSLMNLISARPYGLWSALGLAWFGISVFLCGVFPAYFSFSYMEKEKNRKMTFPIVNLTVPFFLTIGTNTIHALNRFCFQDWMQTVRGILLTAAVLGLGLRLAVAEFRRHTGNWLGAMCFLLIFGLGILAPVNHALDFSEPETVEAAVVDYQYGSGKNRPSYTFALEDGGEVTLTANGEYRVGDRAELEYHRGGLGVAYYCYPDEA